jgi:hypothetical protein
MVEATAGSTTSPSVVQLIVAVVCGGLGGAIFNWLTNRKFRLPPNLNLQLTRPEGERVKVNATGGGTEDVRYYHLRVSNSRRWSAASDVQVFLTRLDQPGPDGTFRPTWVGDVPMRWRDQEIVGLKRTVGHAYDCDLCSVSEGRRLLLMPLLAPFNLNPLRTAACRLALFIQARSTQSDSPMYRVEIAWDGNWESGDAEIQTHVTINVTQPNQ